MNVLVAGGHGFIGSNCVEALRTEGNNVRILSHAETASANAVHGDITEPESLIPALKGMEAVIHCVGLIIEPKGITFESVVRDGTRNLVDACKVAGVQHIIFISALGSRPDAPARYHRTKWEAEEAIRNSGITYTIFRPSIVFGPGDGFINKFLRMPFTPLPSGGSGRFQPIFVKDLAQLVAQSLTNPAARNHVFDAGGPETVTFKELMTTVQAVTGRKKVMIPLPMWFMKLLATIHDPFQKLFPPLALFTHEQYKMLQEDNTGDNTRLHQLFPEVRLHTLSEGLPTYIGRKSPS